MFGVILISVFVGVLLTILLQWLFIRHWFHHQPILDAPWKRQYDKFYLPRELRDALKDPEQKKKKESCLCVNLIFQFLFQELKDTRRIRRWVMRRMNMEFAEMLQTTTGKLLDQITVRDFSLGHQCPIIKNICIQNVSLKGDSLIEELSLLLDLTYKGGFQLAVDVDMVFGKSAYLSVKITKLQGRARLQYTRIPFTHWSFSFTEDPVMEFEVESHFEGRPVPQVTSLIVNQIRRSVRKKHTLPNYKIRYQPFFVKPEPTPTPQDIYYHGNKLSMGHLQVTVVECNRLVKVVGGAYMYCTLAVDTVPWLELMSSRRKLWVTHDIEIIKSQGQNIGLSFKDDYILDRYEEMVVVDAVTPCTPAAYANIKKNDVVVAVGGIKVTNTKQAAKLMKQATDKLVIRIERSSTLKGLRESSSSPEFRFEEDTVSFKDSELLDDPEPNKDESDDYINITLTTPLSSAGNSVITKDDKTAGREMDSSEASLDDITLPGSNSSPSRKGFSILSSSTGLFHRKRSKIERERDNKSPARISIPESKVKGQGQTGTEETPEQKVKVTQRASTSPELQRKKLSKEGSIQGNKDKVKEINDRTESTTSMESVEAGTGECPTAEEQLPGQNSVDLKKTQFLPAAEDLVFNEKFEFDVDESHNYLNICVWCKIPEKLDKQSRVIKPEKDILLGHVSVPLMDIALECLVTLQGDLLMTYKLTPAEMKVGATRNKISNLSSHPGFDEKLCYGDITLEFCHIHAAGPFTKIDRENIAKMKQDAEINALDLNKKMSSSTAKLQQTIKRLPPEEGKHDFIGTHFQSATYCNFCHKKIWLKTAFQCQVCGMVCHKKCTERCQAQTICSREGFQIREPPSMVFHKSMKEKEIKELKEEVKEQLIKDTSGHRTSFLSKFRKERGGSDQGSKALTAETPTDKHGRRPSSPEAVGISPPAERKRHNSAPDEEHLLAGTGDDQVSVSSQGLLNVSGMPRTRSSVSIGDLVESKSSPCTVHKNKMSRSSPDVSASEEEEEMNMLKVYEQQKAAHNADELVVTAAKEMGKELYAHLDFEQRKDKLDSMISKLQQEIDQETENRSELCRLEREARDTNQRAAYKMKIEKSDEKVQSLALLMLHYCAGLQHCMEEQELERQRLLAGATDTKIPGGNKGEKLDVNSLEVSSIMVGEEDDEEEEEDVADEDSSYEDDSCPVGKQAGDVRTGQKKMSVGKDDQEDGQSVSDSISRQQLVMSFQALLSQQDSDSGDDYMDQDHQDPVSDADVMSQQCQDSPTSPGFQSCDSGSDMIDQQAGAVGEPAELAAQHGSVIETAGGVTIMVSETSTTKPT